MNRLASIVVAFLVVAVVMSLPLRSLAQTQDDDLRAKARDLAAEGGGLYQDEQYAEAFTRLDEAYRILRVPTLGFYTGRCLEELGRWVEASDRYLEVTNLALPERSRELHARARTDASDARSHLLPRIPRLSLTVQVIGERSGVAQVSVDGRTIAQSALTQPIPVDPGEHVVVATMGSSRVEERVVATPGEDTQVALDLVIEDEPAIVAPPSPEPPFLPPKPRTIDNSSIRLAGYLMLGIGGAGLVAGAITGGILLSEKGSLDETCIDDECSGTADVDTFNAMRPTTTVLLAVGGAGAAAGLILVLAFPDGIEEGAFTPVITPTGLGLRARF